MYIEFNKLVETVKHMPDGMPHFKLGELYANSSTVDIYGSIVSSEDLLVLGMLVDVLRRKQMVQINLSIHYLIGSRMDRPISDKEPNTLKVVCDYINALQLDTITLTFPHSQSTIDRLQGLPLDHCVHNIRGEQSFLTNGIAWLSKFTPNIGIVLPDAGAEKRWYNDHHAEVLKSLKEKHLIQIDEIVGGTKHRDMATGKLSGFSINSDTVPETCIIVDDLADGGYSFIGLAEKLRESGAKKIGLCVYHGIFSKGLPLRGIDAVYTSNSFKNFDSDGYIKCKRVV